MVHEFKRAMHICTNVVSLIIHCFSGVFIYFSPFVHSSFLSWIQETDNEPLSYFVHPSDTPRKKNTNGAKRRIEGMQYSNGKYDCVVE